MNKLEAFLRLIKQFMDNKKSVQVRLNIHQGDISEKVEVKESMRLDDVMLTCIRIKRDEIIKDILTSPPEKKE